MATYTPMMTTYFGVIEDPDYTDSEEEQSGNMHVHFGDDDSSDSMGLGSGPDLPPPPPVVEEVPLTRNPVMRSGKHKNLTMQQVTDDHIEYYLWAIKKRSLAVPC